MTDADDLVVDVLSALADAERTSIDDLEFALYEHVDPEILVRLTEMGGTWEFSFAVEDHEVTVTSDGRLFVDGILCRTDFPTTGRS